MNEAREEILANIRRALRRGRLDGATEAELMARVAAHRRNVIPARAAALDDSARIELFVSMAEEAQATTARVAGVEQVPGAVADYLARENLPANALWWLIRTSTRSHGRPGRCSGYAATACWLPMRQR